MKNLNFLQKWKNWKNEANNKANAEYKQIRKEFLISINQQKS